jgi:hypothetical protein
MHFLHDMNKINVLFNESLGEWFVFVHQFEVSLSEGYSGLHKKTVNYSSTYKTCHI